MKTSREASKRWSTRVIDDEYDKEHQIGKGTYGEVFRARGKRTGEVVALKRVRLEKEKDGFPITAIREIKLLKQLRHKNIVDLKDIVSDRDKRSILLVFEYMDHDLAGLIEAGYVFDPPTIKCYLKQLLEGMAFCHKNNVMHRDIKAANILISNRGHLKLADFGLARHLLQQNAGHPASYTPGNRVITRWYRPPELLMGGTNYGTNVDMWSVGCIFFELMSRQPLFQGKDDIDQLDRIFKICGTPNDVEWPGLADLPQGHLVHRDPARIFQRCLRDRYKHLGPDALDLLDAFLQLNPNQRITAHSALEHRYFLAKPYPATPAEIQPYDKPCHDFNVKEKRNRDKSRQHQTARRANLQKPGHVDPKAPGSIPIKPKNARRPPGTDHPPSKRQHTAPYAPPGMAAAAGDDTPEPPEPPPVHASLARP